MRHLHASCVLLLSLLATVSSLAAPGDPDLNFPDVQLNGESSSVAVLGDGSILVDTRGSGYTISGFSYQDMARLNGHGTLDRRFRPGVGMGTVSAMAVQADGRVVLGGGFASVGGVLRTNLARINPDGTLDASFNPSADSDVNSMALQPDGKLVIGGGFIKVNGVARAGLARINPDGTLDTGFNPKVSGVQGVAIQEDGKLVIAGYFTTVGGTSRRLLARLNADGTLDQAFNAGVIGGTAVYEVAVQADGKVVFVGDFTKIGGTTGVSRKLVARVNADGTPDLTFDPQPTVETTGGNGPWYSSLALQADGKILVGSYFSKMGGLARKSLARLNPDGSVDTTFDARLASSGNSQVSAYSLAVRPDGKVVVVGYFQSAGSETRHSLAVLLNDPATQSLTVPDSSRIEWLRGGSSPEAQYVAFELSTDRGASWSSLGLATRIAGGWELTGLNLPNNCLVRGSARVIGGLVQAVTAIPSSAPPLVVKPIGTIEVDEDAPPTVINLRNVFQDTETASADLVYSLKVDGTDDPNTIAPSLDSAAGTLTLTYGARRHGSAEMTVRATDAAGLWVEDSFTVTVKTVPDGDPGDLDPGYKPAPASSVGLLAVQADGKAIVNFNGLQRLNADGSVDAGFSPNQANYPGLLGSAAVQNNGSIIIGGSFSSTGPEGRTNIARLNADGTLDMGFNAIVHTTTSFNPGSVNSIAVQADGRILITGDFTRVNGVVRNYVARLNSDGTLDTTFNPNPSGFPQPPFDVRVVQSAVQADGRILLWGSFTKIAGVTRNGLARMNVDGTLDTGFNPDVTGFSNPGGDPRPWVAAVQGVKTLSDGRILMWGFFTRVGGAPRVGLVRLNADGTTDTSFDLGLDGAVTGLAFQADGKVLFWGSFTRAGGVERHRLARLNADGTLDNLFNPDVAAGNFFARIERDGEILLSGSITTVGGLPPTRLPNRDIPLANDPATQSLSATSPNRIQWLRGGGQPEAAAVFFELSVDRGATWSLLGAGTPIAGGWELTGLNLPASGLLRAHAWVDTGLVQTIVAFPFDAPPTVVHRLVDLDVTQGGPSTVIDLRAVFQDAETPASDLVYPSRRTTIRRSFPPRSTAPMARSRSPTGPRMTRRQPRSPCAPPTELGSPSRILSP